MAPSPSLLYPILDSPDFPPGKEDKRFTILKELGFDRAEKFIEGNTCLSQAKIINTVGSNATGFFGRFQLSHFLNKKEKHISKVYNMLLTEASGKNLYYLKE